MVVRELAVLLGLKVDNNSFAGGKLALASLTAVMSKVADAAVHAAHSLLENTKEAIEYGDKIKKTSQSIGIATDALQELQYAGSLADLSAEEMSQSIGILSRKMLEAKQGSEEAGKAFHGIKFQENGKLLATDEVLGNIADRFAKMPDGAEKTATAMQMFGRAGKQMIPLLNKGSKDLEELREEARSLGLVLDHDAIEKSEELNDNLHRLHAVTQGLWRQAIGPLIPVLSDLAKRFLAWRKANAAILAQKIEKYVQLVIKWIKIFASTVAAVGSQVILVAKGIGNGFLALWEIIGPGGRKAFAVLGAAFLAFKAGPLGVVLAAFTFLMDVLDDIRGYREGEDSLFGTFKDEIASWLEPNANDPWWLQALKEMVELMARALGLAKDLGLTKEPDARRGSIQAAQAGAGAVGDYLARENIASSELDYALANPGLRSSQERIAAPRGTWDAAKIGWNRIFGSSPTPETRPGMWASQAVPMRSSTSVHIDKIIQNPGEDSVAFANRVGEVVDQKINGHLEAAVASGKR